MSKLWHMSRPEAAEFISGQLARLRTDSENEPAAIVARKKREVAERLKRQDTMFGNYWGSTLGVEPPRWEAGDDQEARED